MAAMGDWTTPQARPQIPIGLSDLEANSRRAIWSRVAVGQLGSWCSELAAGGAHAAPADRRVAAQLRLAARTIDAGAQFEHAAAERRAAAGRATRGALAALAVAEPRTGDEAILERRGALGAVVGVRGADGL